MTQAELAALEAALPTMTEAEVRAAYDKAEVESPEADIIAGEMERRQIDW